MSRTKSRGFNPCPFSPKPRTRRYFVEFNYRHEAEELYLGRVDLIADSSGQSLIDHKEIANWTMMALLGGADQYRLTKSALNLTAKEARHHLTGKETATLIRWGQKPATVFPNQAFAFDGEKCLWRIDIDNPNGGNRAVLTDVTGRDRTVWVSREFDRPPQAYPTNPHR